MIVAMDQNRLEVRVVYLVVSHQIAATVHDHPRRTRLVSAVEIMNAAVRHDVFSGYEVLLASAPQYDPSRSGVVYFASFDDMLLTGISISDGIEIHVRMETSDLP